MGAVYLAEDQRLPTQWAIKEMKREGLSPQELTEAAELFRTEARLLSDLRHRNLPRIVDFFQQDVQLYLVMDFIEGETLETRVMRDGPLPLPFALDLCLQISDVLDYLHTRKEPIIFRDFKPGNVMLTPHNEVKLVDFGIARIFRHDQSADTRALGTPGYAAPEQYGKGQSDPRTDLYAFGATIHHALTGRDPTAEPFVFPPLREFRQDLPEEFIGLLDACLSLQPNGRPESAFAIKRSLEQMLGLTGSAALVGRPTTTRLTGEPTVSATATIAASATTPATVPFSPSAEVTPAATTTSVAHSVQFVPNALTFKDLVCGAKATARLRVKTTLPITLMSSSAQIAIEPAELEGNATTTVMVTLDSRGLEAGSIYRAAVEVKEVEEADLPVEAHLAHPRASTLAMVTAILLCVGTLIPLVNYFCTTVLSVVVLSTPKPQRSSMRIPWRLSFFFSLCWSALFAAIAVGMTQFVDLSELWLRLTNGQII